VLCDSGKGVTVCPAGIIGHACHRCDVLSRDSRLGGQQRLTWVMKNRWRPRWYVQYSTARGSPEATCCATRLPSPSDSLFGLQQGQQGQSTC
jgi:hypothetical protein